MQVRVAAAMLTGFALAALVVASGCSKTPMSPETAVGNLIPGTNGGQDTVPPPPPPPAPVSPVVYLGADTVQVGGTVTQHWRLTNESASSFTMQWTLAAVPAWPGLPQSGSMLLAGKESRDLTTTASIPDTAAYGWRWLRLIVTRPDGSDASVNGPFLLRP